MFMPLLRQVLPQGSCCPVRRPVDAYSTYLQSNMGILTDGHWQRLVQVCRTAVARCYAYPPGHAEYRYTFNLEMVRLALPALATGADLSLSMSYGHIAGHLQDLFRDACEPGFTSLVLELHRERAQGPGAAHPPRPSPQEQNAADQGARRADDAYRHTRGSRPDRHDARPAPPSGAEWSERLAAHALWFEPVVPPPVSEPAAVAALVGNAAIDRYSVDDCTRASMPQMDRVPPDDGVQTQWARCYATVTGWIREAVERNDPVCLARALKWERILWPLIWRLPPPGKARRKQCNLRMAKFLAGQYAAVLEWYFQDCATVRAQRAAASPLPRGAKSNVELSLAKLRRGWARRAYRALHSGGLADLSKPGILADLRSRFPKRGTSYLPAVGEFEPFDPVQVDMRRHLSALENGRATSLGGCRHEYLTVLARNFSDPLASQAIEGAQFLAERILAGALPPWYHQVLAAAILVPLDKEGKAVRPYSGRRRISQRCLELRGPNPQGTHQQGMLAPCHWEWRDRRGCARVPLRPRAVGLAPRLGGRVGRHP